MVYIFTALYCEAQIFISHFHLIKNQESTWFQQFYNETAGILLTVTGVGEIAAAAVVGSVCSVHKPTQDDMLLNIGICAHTTQNSGIFLCNKIIEKATDRTFYPDMLYRHNFSEGTIVTQMRPYESDSDNAYADTGEHGGLLYDMEAAAVYQTGIHFFGPHQMSFLKIVSDMGDVKEVSKESTVRLMEKYKQCVFDYIGQLVAITRTSRCRGVCMNHEEETFVEKFCMDIHCSKAMRDSVRQYIWYLELTGTDYIGVMRNMYEEGLIPCKDKKEGKQRLEEFKRRIF